MKALFDLSDMSGYFLGTGHLSYEPNSIVYKKC